jgi:DNA-binding NtrC family response regulator
MDDAVFQTPSRFQAQAPAAAPAPAPRPGLHLFATKDGFDGALEEANLLDLMLIDAREHFERTYLHALNVHYAGRVSLIAKHCGMERTHLYRKLRQLGVRTKQPEPVIEATSHEE